MKAKWWSQKVLILLKLALIGLTESGQIFLYLENFLPVEQEIVEFELDVIVVIELDVIVVIGLDVIVVIELDEIGEMELDVLEKKMVLGLTRAGFLHNFAAN